MKITSNDVERFLNQNANDYPFDGVTCNEIFHQMAQDLFEFLKNEREKE
ncbi:hypothetical protein LCGC14_1381210 [marine sediment metagenome]|uniref:Uncharacterized protein n=1 Tax=marine sediment metagenome TaxID=412755 RepID=A0A0F9MI28_9ZZZZ